MLSNRAQKRKGFCGGCRGWLQGGLLAKQEGGRTHGCCWLGAEHDGDRELGCRGCVASAPMIDEESMAQLERGYTVEGVGDVEELADVAGGMHTIKR